MISLGEEVAGGEEAFAEVAGHDLFGVADGGEIDAGVPSLEYIDICRYTIQVAGRQSLAIGLIEKWFEEFGYAAGMHGFPIVDHGMVADGSFAQQRRRAVREPEIRARRGS